MNTTVTLAPVRALQKSTGRTFTLLQTTPDEWAGQWPTDRTGDVLVTELPGTACGSHFIYWLGTKTLASPGVLESIEAHLDDHDVIATNVVYGFPDDVHASLKQDLADLKAAAGGTASVCHSTSSLPA